VRLLFDQNLSFKLCRRLSNLFPGSRQVRLLGLDRADDRAVWDYAGANGFVLVSQDADFAEMATLFGPPPKVIWLRGGNRPTAAVEEKAAPQSPDDHRLRGKRRGSLPGDLLNGIPPELWKKFLDNAFPFCYNGRTALR
jgi:predicted nuclease of predicted toxin-antitoxin system